MNNISRVAVLTVLVLGAAVLAGCSPKFSAETIHGIAQEVSGLPADDAIDAIMEKLHERYPGQFRKELKWHFNYAGGTLGQMAILYASLNEYVLIFGTPIGSEGFSGRYPAMDVYDCMFAGEMWTYTEGQTEKTVYVPGDMAVLERGVAKGYSMAPGTWMLEYTQGATALSLRTGLFAPNSVLNDWQTLWGVFTDYAGLVLGSFFQ